MSSFRSAVTRLPAIDSLARFWVVRSLLITTAKIQQDAHRMSRVKPSKAIEKKQTFDFTHENMPLNANDGDMTTGRATYFPDTQVECTMPNVLSINHSRPKLK